MSSENNPLLFPLTDEEMKELRKGKVLMKHYHNVHYPEDTLAILLGKKIEREKYNYLLPRGINIAEQPIEDEAKFFDMLEEGVWMSKQLSPEGFPLYIAFLKQDFFEKLRREGR